MSKKDIKVPNIGEFKDVEVIEVLIKKGQKIKKNDPLITIESDKSSIEIPSSDDGTIVSLNVKIPSQPMARRSDDALKFNCKTADGKTGFGSIPSEIESGKLAGSVVFFDLGITDSITDKHRTYPASFVIPVN